ncbi:hypothetical protein BYT27DRAFT_7260727 [Phlegmacium glaucopus]|nr:hypothetical protein BYT27DRAFT_7260727 [Phlegmacium glaucopus]
MNTWIQQYHKWNLKFCCRPTKFQIVFSALCSFQPPPPQPIQTSVPCLPSPLRALLTLYGAHQLEDLGTALTVINALLTDPLCEEKFIRNSTHRFTWVS